MGPEFFYAGKRNETYDQIKMFAKNHNFIKVKYIGTEQLPNLTYNNIYCLEQVILEGCSTRYKLFNMNGFYSSLLFEGVECSPSDNIILFRLL